MKHTHMKKTEEATKSKKTGEIRAIRGKKNRRHVAYPPYDCDCRIPNPLALVTAWMRLLTPSLP